MSRITLQNTFSSGAIGQAIGLSNQFELAEWIKEKTSSQNFVAFSVVIMLHLAALFGLFHQFKNSSQPVLSFTVTMMDVSATSSNVVSSAASTASKSSAKAATKVEENQASAMATTKAAEQISLEQAKSKSAQAHNSAQQTAVVAPTTAAVFDAAYLNNAAPNYPALSRHLQEQGIVTLNVFVGTDGKAQNVVVKKSSGFERLDSAALTTVKKWKFMAAKQGEILVSSWVQVPVSFVLEK